MVNVQQVVFYVAATLTILAALFVITAKNPVKAVLSLVVACFMTSITWIIMDAEFLAIILILVYVGAVMVLFLFVVMMLDINESTQNRRFSNWILIGCLPPSILGLILAHSYKLDEFLKTPVSILENNPHYNNVKVIGETIFTNNLLQFEIAGVILLVAIIAAISIIFKGPRLRKVQNVSTQVQIKSRDRIRLVNL